MGDEMSDEKGRVPDRIGIDAAGFGWRAWDDVEYLSMVPTNPDNEPVPEPVTWYFPVAEALIQRAIEEWAALAGGPNGTEAEPTLARYIADRLSQSGSDAR